MPTPIPPPPATPKILTGREVYDMLMMHIEPELTSENVTKLAKQYANETPAEHEDRMRRYATSIEQCEQAYQDYLQTLDTQVNRYRREVFTRAEVTDRSNEEPMIGRFDALFQQAA